MTIKPKPKACTCEGNYVWCVRRCDVVLTQAQSECCVSCPLSGNMLCPLTFIAVADNDGAILVPPQVPSESFPFFLATHIGKDVYQILSHAGSSRAHVE